MGIVVTTFVAARIAQLEKRAKREQELAERKAHNARVLRRMQK